jgi:hypothetical protein
MAVLWVSPAAASLEPQCNAGNVCNFEDGQFLKSIWQTPANDLDYSDNAFPSGTALNDKTSSVDNDGLQCGTRHYEHKQAQNNGGLSIALPVDGFWFNMPGGWNDRISSHKWCV